MDREGQILMVVDLPIWMLGITRLALDMEDEIVIKKVGQFTCLVAGHQQDGQGGGQDHS